MDPSIYFIRNVIINPQSIDKNLLCLICQQLVIDPQECESCQTLFCSLCINQWLQNSQTCPNNCKQIKLNQPHRMFKNAIQQILVKCGNYACQQQMKIEDWDNHTKNCKYKIDFNKETTYQVQNDQFRTNQCDKCNTQFIVSHQHDCIKSLNAKIQELEINYQQFQQKTTKIITDLLERVAQCEKQQKQLIGPQCDQSHMLRWIYPLHGAKCQNCQLSNTTARYFCEWCRTYYCQKCRKPQFKDGVCPVNHALQFNLQALPQVHCDYCMLNIYSRGQSVYSDRICDLDICNSCYQTQLKNNQ